MKKILLVLSTSRTPEEAMDFAVSKAKEEGAVLYALYLVETALASEVFDRFSDIGFIGDKPSTELSEAVMKEYRQRGYEEVGRVQVKAMEAAVTFEPLTEQGDYVGKTLELAEDLDIDLIVAIRRKHSIITRYFSRSPADELKKGAPCEVEIFDEE
ncbi:MAG: universal stress protein [Thermodesulfobacteriota bacterium]